MSVNMRCITTVHIIKKATVSKSQNVKDSDDSTQLNRELRMQVSESDTSKSASSLYTITSEQYDFFWSVSGTRQIGCKIKLHWLVLPKLIWACFKCINSANISDWIRLVVGTVWATTDFPTPEPCESSPPTEQWRYTKRPATVNARSAVCKPGQYRKSSSRG